MEAILEVVLNYLARKNQRLLFWLVFIAALVVGVGFWLYQINMPRFGAVR